ncbi:hypothetical protein ADU59_09420 [Pararhizobium polonicum]|uniref:Uncharacterized protein n=1 Tax=Pararhizobium polonicum TaxID=1612624 RepID=A0A1C7P7B2_9HYPH|nr:hypothetical protein ADU59_09420 [Pararhizobium polonicum]
MYLPPHLTDREHAETGGRNPAAMAGKASKRPWTFRSPARAGWRHQRAVTVSIWASLGIAGAVPPQAHRHAIFGGQGTCVKLLDELIGQGIAAWAAFRPSFA